MNKLILIVFVIKVVFQQYECQSFNSTTNSQPFSTSNSTLNSNVSLSTIKPINRLFNESCEDNSQCYGPLDCKHHKCQCLPGYIWSNLTKKCLINDYTIKQCNFTSQCKEYDPNMICLFNGRCDCQIGYQMSQFKCYPFVKSTNQPTKITTKNPLKTHNAYCNDDYGIRCNSTLICKYSSCKCPLGYMWSNRLGKCVSFSQGICTYNSECQDLDSNRICSFESCECKSGYQLDYYSSLCVAKTNVIGASCKYDYQCDVVNSYCSDNSQCICKIFYEKSSDSTYCKSNKCYSNYDCYSVDINSHCNYYSQCECDSNYYYTNSKCVRYSYNYHYSYDFFWFLILIPLICCCVCIRACCLTGRRVLHGNETTCHTIHTSSPAVPFGQNHLIAPTAPTSTAQINFSHPPFDSPPKYSEAIASTR